MCYSPSLTESWAIVYFEVTVAIMIFGIGVPSLIMQAIVSEHIRDIVYRHRKGQRGIFAFVISLAVCALSFVWILRDQRTYAVSDSSLNPGGGSLLLELLNFLQQKPIADWTSAILMTFAILAMTFFLYFQNFYRRDRLLEYLQEKCKSKIARSGSLDEKILMDIRSLGEHSQSNMDRKKVLVVLRRLADTMLARQGYTGTRLQPVFQAFPVTLRGGSTDTFMRAGKILRRIIIRLQRGGLNHSPDCMAALNSLQHIGELALELESEMAALTILDMVTLVGQGADGIYRETSRILFELGNRGLDLNRFLFATAALNRLEAMADQEPALLANYLGLLSHFWNAGPTAKQRAQRSLEKITFHSSLRECIHSAQKHHTTLAHFKTADNLEILFENISQIQPRRIARLTKRKIK